MDISRKRNGLPSSFAPFKIFGRGEMLTFLEKNRFLLSHWLIKFYRRWSSGGIIASIVCVSYTVFL